MQQTFVVHLELVNHFPQLLQFLFHDKHSNADMRSQEGWLAVRQTEASAQRQTTREASAQMNPKAYGAVGRRSGRRRRGSGRRPGGVGRQRQTTREASARQRQTTRERRAAAADDPEASARRRADDDPGGVGRPEAADERPGRRRSGGGGRRPGRRRSGGRRTTTRAAAQAGGREPGRRRSGGGDDDPGAAPAARRAADDDPSGKHASARIWDKQSQENRRMTHDMSGCRERAPARRLAVKTRRRGAVTSQVKPVTLWALRAGSAP
ncbi:hypothetical protein CRUP_034744 [Coryphaenoides rupestris]|nr:hypothetical protein CRUP_034744 [Coryphaenoides rupestris]